MTQAITLFLLNRLRSQRSRSLILLTIFFLLLTVFTGLLVMDSTLSPFHRLLTAYAENTILALARSDHINWRNLLTG